MTSYYYGWCFLVGKRCNTNLEDKRMARASGWCELLVSGSVYASEVWADFIIKTVDGQHLARDCSKNPSNHEIFAYICHVN